MLSKDQMTQLKQKLDEKGEATVRREFSNNVYSGANKIYVQSWLDELEREKIKNKDLQESQQYKEQRQTENDRFQLQLEVSKSQASSAKSSANIAKISAIIAAISAIASIASLIYSFLKK